MYAKDFPIGTLFKNKETGRIIEVIEDKCTGQIWFEDVEYGDLYLYVDEDLYKKYIKE